MSLHVDPMSKLFTDLSDDEARDLERLCHRIADGPLPTTLPDHPAIGTWLEATNMNGMVIPQARPGLVAAMQFHLILSHFTRYALLSTTAHWRGIVEEINSQALAGTFP